MAKILFCVIADKARPVEKASIDTPKANRNMPKREKFISSNGSFFIKSINKLAAMKSKIQPKNKLLFMEKKFMRF